MIRAYTGKTGSGKTYNMVKDAFEFWREGVNIYSNTFLSFDGKLDGKIKMTFWETVKIKVFKKELPPRGKIFYFENINEIIDIKNGVVLFDEAQVLFNARLWESLPDEFQYKLQQHRKHKIDLLCTTQNMGTIDITYRRLVHSWIHCKNIFQLGVSPKIWFGWFLAEEKDIDYLYNSVDDLTVPTVKSKPFFIHYFSKVLYDTMYDIGFKKLKILWLYDPIKQKTKVIIANKKEKLQSVLRSSSTIQSALSPKKSSSFTKR